MAHNIHQPERGGMSAKDSAKTLFELGVVYSSDRLVPADLISAHKWFNLAATRGNQEAVRHRQEIAAEMSPREIAAAQRAARDWRATH